MEVYFLKAEAVHANSISGVTTPRHTKPWDQYRKNTLPTSNLLMKSVYFCFVSNIVSSTFSSLPSKMYCSRWMPNKPTAAVDPHHPITCSLEFCRGNQSPFTSLDQTPENKNCRIPNMTDRHSPLRNLRPQNLTRVPCRQTANDLVCDSVVASVTLKSANSFFLLYETNL